MLTAVTGVNALGNLLVHVLVARAGGVDSYGRVGALLSLGVVAATLASGVQYAVTRRSSLSPAKAETLLLDGLFAAAPWLLLILAAAACSPIIESYLHLDSVVPVLLALLYCLALVLYAIPAGVLVGRRRIVAFGVLTAGSTVLRIAYGFVLGWGGADGRGALASSGLAVLTATVLGVVVLVLLRRPWPVPRSVAVVRSRLALAAEGATGAVLSALLWGTWTAPLLFARHFLDADSAGNFAAAQLMVSAVLFLTAGLATAFYPSVVRTGRTKEAAVGLAATFVVSALAVLVATGAGPLVVVHLYGSQFGADAAVFLALGVSVITVSCLTYLLWAAQALQRHVLTVAVTILAALVAQLVIGGTWHGSALSLALGPAISCVVGGVVAAVVIRGRGRRGGDGLPRRLVVRSHAGPGNEVRGLLAETAVGVMVHNEADMVQPVLEAILAQTDGHTGVARVVVVASECTDSTEDIVRDVAARDSRVQLLTEERRNGKAAAINWFLNVTTEPLCLLVGGDVICAPGSLARLVAPFANPRVGMTGAHIFPTNRRRGIVGRLVHVLWEMHHQVAMLRPKLGEAVAFRRVIERIDAETIVDEVSLESEVVKAGYELQYAGDAHVYNHGATSLSDYVAHRERINRGHFGVQYETGYVPATSDRRLLVRAGWRALRHHPLSLPSLAVAVAVEGWVRHHAWRAHRLAIEARKGRWAPIASAKRTFVVEFESVELTGRRAGRRGQESPVSAREVS